MIDLACIVVAHAAPLAGCLLARLGREIRGASTQAPTDHAQRRRDALQAELMKRREAPTFDQAAKHWRIERRDAR